MLFNDPYCDNALGNLLTVIIIIQTFLWFTTLKLGEFLRWRIFSDETTGLCTKTKGRKNDWLCVCLQRDSCMIQVVTSFTLLDFNNNNLWIGPQDLDSFARRCVVCIRCLDAISFNFHYWSRRFLNKHKPKINGG